MDQRWRKIAKNHGSNTTYMWYYRTVAWNKLEELFFSSKLISAFMELQASQQGWCDHVHLPSGKFTSKGQRSNTCLEYLLVLTDNWVLSCLTEPCYLPYSKFSWQDLWFLCHLWDACFSLQHQLVGLGPSDLEAPDSLSRVMPCITPVPTGCNGTNHMVPLILALPPRLRHLCLACLKHGNDQFFLKFAFLSHQQNPNGLGLAPIRGSLLLWRVMFGGLLSRWIESILEVVGLAGRWCALWEGRARKKGGSVGRHSVYPTFWSSAKLTEIRTKHRSPYNCEIRSEVEIFP